MIKVKRLKELLEQVPDDADVWVYEGEDTGIVIRDFSGDMPYRESVWWIRAREGADEEYTEGFD